MVGEHTERLPAVPVGEYCAGLKGVRETAAVKGNRATHFKLCGGTLGQPLVHIQQVELIINAKVYMYIHRVSVQMTLHIRTYALTPVPIPLTSCGPLLATG